MRKKWMKRMMPLMRKVGNMSCALALAVTALELSGPPYCTFIIHQPKIPSKYRSKFEKQDELV